MSAQSLPADRSPNVRLLVALLVGLLLAGAVAAAPALAGPLDVVYDWPVPGPIVRPFDAPSSPHGPGHRGVDLQVAEGELIRPMADGIMLFSGTIAGDTWVTVQHRDGVVTSYGPVLWPRNTLGRAVTTDDVIGRARGDVHDISGRLHVGARLAGRYIDPATLVSQSPVQVATLVGPGDVRAVVTEDRVPRPVLVPGTPPSPNHLVVLAGLTSATGGQPFDVAALGYWPDTWQQYSYAGVDDNGDPAPYGHRDTWGRVHDMASGLRDQLRAVAAQRPGQAVDLMAHSLGGLVAMYYLLVLHDATDPTLPPIGRIVTMASPLQGADSADAAVQARDHLVGRLLLDLAALHVAPKMSPDMPVLDDLQVGSDVARAIAEAWKRSQKDPYASPLATGTEVLTVGSVLDPVVSEHRSGLPGADHEAVFDPSPLSSHGGVTTDARATDVLLAFLAGEPLPDRSLKDHLVNALAPVGSHAMAGFEHLVASAIETFSRRL